jgi:hypothetical protein
MCCVQLGQSASLLVQTSLNEGALMFSKVGLQKLCFGPIADILPGEPYVGRLVRANPIALLFADPRRTWQDPQADEAELASLDSKYEASD